MDNKQFNRFIKDFKANSPEAAMEVHTLKGHYPYSQVLHVLAAMVARDLHSSGVNQELNTAAVYSTDRSILKVIMSGKQVHVSPLENLPIENGDTNTLETTTPEASRVDQAPQPTAPTLAPVVPSVQDTTHDYAADVIHDLELLSESKHRFEDLIDTLDQQKKTPPQTPRKKVESEESETPPLGKKIETEESITPLPTKTTDKRSKKERIIELAKGLQTPSHPIPQPEKKKGKKHKEPTENLLEEIADKLEIRPPNEKQREQIHIIDEFIKSGPVLITKEKAIPTGDLSAGKPGEFSDSVVSETLVNLLARQGKKEKAIEVLKKLIWKFPQKKAYFAAQIEELKK